MVGFLSSLFMWGFLILIVLIIFTIASYNNLQKLAHNVREASSNITVTLRRRVDLINKLQEIASAYGEHEKMTQITVADMESNMGKLAMASKEADVAMSKVIGVARNYPELKANETYQMLMQQINSVETDLQKARERYNHTVNLYNTKRGSIPTVFIASRFGFHQAPYFNPEAAEGLNNVQNFATEDGELLKATLLKAGYQAIEGTKHLGRAIEEKTRKIINSLPDANVRDKDKVLSETGENYVTEEKVSKDNIPSDKLQEPKS